MGDFENGIYGDLLVKITLTNESGFEKFGEHLLYNKYFTLDDLNQENFVIPHPQGEIMVNFPKQMDTSKPLRLKGKGFKGRNVIGDLLVKQFLKYERS
jgi:DnaJ-class molecular chaperone